MAGGRGQLVPLYPYNNFQVREKPVAFAKEDMSDKVSTPYGWVGISSFIAQKNNNMSIIVAETTHSCY